MSPARALSGDDEGEVALERHEFRALQLGLGLGRPRLRRRDRVEHDLEGDERPLDVERFAGARVQFAEPAGDVLGAELQRRASGRDAGKRGRRATICTALAATPSAASSASASPLASKTSTAPRARPMPSLALALGAAAPQRRRGDALIVLAVAEEDLADLEQRDVLQSAPRVALGGRGEAGDEARPHVREIGRDRIGERQAPARRRRTARLPASR